jgi:hypothetical protein
MDPRAMENEYAVLKAMEAIPLFTHRVFGFDAQGEWLGVACFFSELSMASRCLIPCWSAKPGQI